MKLFSLLQHPDFLLASTDADPILGEFFVKYYGYLFLKTYFNNAVGSKNQAAALGVSGDALYNALVQDAEHEPSSWNFQGRQADAWVKYSQ